MSDTQSETIGGMKEQIRSQAKEIAGLKEALEKSHENNSKSVEKLTKEVRDLTSAVQPMAEIMPELKDLLIKAAEVDGMTKLARVMLGGGVLVAIGAALAGVFRWFSHGGG